MINEYELPLFTFGWELEATGRASRTLKDVLVGHDGSVGGDGLEYRIRREAVFDPERSLAALRVLTGSPGLNVDRSCGFHVHVGLGIKTRKLHLWAANFITLARLIENDVFTVVPESRRDNNYCRRWREHSGSVITPQYSGSKHSNGTRYCWVNPVEIFRPGGIRTIEVRLMGDSKNYLYLLAWTSFCRRMAASAWVLVHDPSRMEQELRTLKEDLVTIRECFVTRRFTGLTKANAIVLLAAKAGFYTALEPTLAPLKEREKKLRWEMDKDAQARDEYHDRVKQIRDYLAREAKSLVGTHFSEPLTPGDMVEALITEPDYALTAGQRFRVVRDTPENGHVQVEHQRSDGWNIPRSFVRLAERTAVAVPA